ncbi:MAG TPA: pyrimidine reductase family protein [Streptosporangiaceae bacterium]|nr:pyrimidine reductase family protein [Streptosporangiaceae bacterium]
MSHWSGSFADVDLATAYAYPADRPWLRANMIASLDGSAWWGDRTGPLGDKHDRELFQLLRGLADVVIVGAGTVRIEGYGAVRPRSEWDALRAGRPPAPPLAVVSRALNLDFDGPLFTPGRERTIVLTTEAAPTSQRKAAEEKADVIVAGQDDVDLRAAADALVERGHTRLLCEGGPRLLAQIAAAGLLDELCLTLSPVLLAGDAARILNGTPLPAPCHYRLEHILTGDDHLFLRYLTRPAPAGEQAGE